MMKTENMKCNILFLNKYFEIMSARASSPTTQAGPSSRMVNATRVREMFQSGLLKDRWVAVRVRGPNKDKKRVNKQPDTCDDDIVISNLETKSMEELRLIYREVCQSDPDKSTREDLIYNIVLEGKLSIGFHPLVVMVNDICYRLAASQRVQTHVGASSDQY